jgi:hypothetical protein
VLIMIKSLRRFRRWATPTTPTACPGRRGPSTVSGGDPIGPCSIDSFNATYSSRLASGNLEGRWLMADAWRMISWCQPWWASTLWANKSVRLLNACLPQLGVPRLLRYDGGGHLWRGRPMEGFSRNHWRTGRRYLMPARSTTIGSPAWCRWRMSASRRGGRERLRRPAAVMTTKLNGSCGCRTTENLPARSSGLRAS